MELQICDYLHDGFKELRAMKESGLHVAMAYWVRHKAGDDHILCLAFDKEKHPDIWNSPNAARIAIADALKINHKSGLFRRKLLTNSLDDVYDFKLASNERNSRDYVGQPPSVYRLVNHFIQGDVCRWWDIYSSSCH